MSFDVNPMDEVPADRESYELFELQQEQERKQKGMRIYLASRYSRREELCVYRDQLQSIGHEVTARWLEGKHQISDLGTPIGEHGEALVEDDDESTHTRCAALRSKFAREDYEDVMAADMLIAFTEKPRSELTRGGRHVELGVAIGAGKIVIIVGPRENLFCWMDTVLHFDRWPQCMQTLAESKLQAITGHGCVSDLHQLPPLDPAKVENRSSSYTLRSSLSPERVGPNDYTARPSKPIEEQPMLMPEESQTSLDGFLSHPPRPNEDYLNPHAGQGSTAG